MKAPLVAMLLFTLFVAAITMAYKSAQSLMFIKPGSGFSLSSLNIGGSAPSGQGVWHYELASNKLQQEKMNGPLDSSKIFAFIHDPGNAQNVYAATSAGLYFYQGSNDSWTYLAGGIPSDAQILSVSVNAHSASHIFVSILQNDGTSAIWHSQDKGKTFVRIYAASAPQEKIIDVIDDWYAPQRVFALTDQGTFLRSDDEGFSWRVAYQLGRLVPSAKHIGFTHLVMDSNDSRMLYALRPDVGFLQSTDSGATWQSDENAFASFPESAKKINNLRSVEGESGGLYCATNYGILRSANWGKSFVLVHSLVIENSIPIQEIDLGKDNQNLFMAAGNIVYESRDNGKTWETHSLPNAQKVSVFIYISTPTRKIFVGTR